MSKNGKIGSIVEIYMAAQIKGKVVAMFVLMPICWESSESTSGDSPTLSQYELHTPRRLMTQLRTSTIASDPSFSSSFVYTGISTSALTALFYIDQGHCYPETLIP